MLEDITGLGKQQKKIEFNLNKEEMDAFRELTLDNSVTIKTADKGRGIVILDTYDYKTETLRQSPDPQYYQILPNDPTRHLMNIVRSTITEGMNFGNISPNREAYLINEHPRTSLFMFYLMFISQVKALLEDLSSVDAIQCWIQILNILNLFFKLLFLQLSLTLETVRILSPKLTI